MRFVSQQAKRARAGAALFALAIAGLAVASPAVGFQTAYYSAAGSFGTRATINGSATALPGASGVIATVRIQSSISDGSAGLIQYGHLKQAGGSTTACGGPNTIGYMLEWKNVGGGYTCSVFFGSFGSSQQFALTRGNPSSEWNARLNGTQVTNRNLNFSSGVSLSPAEWVLGPSPGNYNFSWSTWQRQTAVGNPWGVITSTTHLEDNAVFVLSGVPPTFSIHS